MVILWVSSWPVLCVLTVDVPRSAKAAVFPLKNILSNLLNYRIHIILH